MSIVSKEKIAKYARDGLLRRTYGISDDIYNSYFEAQDGRCAICGIHQSKLNRRLFVDHCHTTGRVRGLLCYRCNTALGLFNDSEDQLNNALAYLAERS